MAAPLRILLADDHRLVRDALRLMLESEADLQVVAEASDGHEVLRLAQQFQPDLICMDIAMPGINGIEATEQLRTLCPQCRVIGLSAYADQRFILDMLRAGATGYVTKADGGEELLRAIRAVAKQQTYLCAAAAAAVTGAMRSPKQGASFPAGQLGARERQVLQLVAEGHTSASIGRLLNIAASTVEVHRRNLMRKLGLHTIADLTKYALGCGLVGGAPASGSEPNADRS